MDLVNEVTLAGIAHGAAAELFEAAQAEVLRNLTDPNTDWKARRRVTLTFDYAIDEARRSGDVEVKCQTKLAGIKGVTTQIVVGRHLGVLKAVEQPGQEELFTQPQGGPRPIETVGGAGGGKP